MIRRQLSTCGSVFRHDGVHTWMMVQKPQTTTWDVKKTVNNGMNYHINWCRIFVHQQHGTFSPRIMVQWEMALLEGSIFHFHVYGRKGVFAGKHLGLKQQATKVWVSSNREGGSVWFETAMCNSVTTMWIQFCYVSGNAKKNSGDISVCRLEVREVGR